MSFSPPDRMIRWLVLAVASVVGFLLLAAFGLMLCQQVWGGPRLIRAGEAYGFRIGMSKPELFRYYQDLGESTNLRSFGADGEVFYPSIAEAGKWQMSGAFLSGDRWVGYRARYPVWFQEFEFERGRLVQIVTHVRFYETP